MANKMETREKIPKQRTTNDRKTMGRRDLSEMKRTNERSQAQTCTHAEKIGHYLLFYSWFGDARACACKQSCKQSTGNMSLENAKQSHGKKNSFFRAVVVISVAALYFSLFSPISSFSRSSSEHSHSVSYLSFCIPLPSVYVSPLMVVWL